MSKRSAGEKGKARAGARALMLLSVPLNAAVVRGLAEGPRSLAELRDAADSPAPTTIRDYVVALERVGVVERHRNDSRGAIGYGLTESGRDLLGVAHSLVDWLRAAPLGAIELGSAESKRAIKALVDAWSTSIVRALATRPLALTELNNAIASLSYPSLERRLAALRRFGLIEAAPGGGRRTPYSATDWMRRAIGPITAAARWEQRHEVEDTRPTTNRDFEAAFLLPLPLLRLAPSASGFCRLAVQMRGGHVNRLAGVIAEVREGAVVSCITRLEGSAHAWALGSIGAWLPAILKGDQRGLELGGDTQLALEIVAGLHEALASHRVDSDTGQDTAQSTIVEQ